MEFMDEIAIIGSGNGGRAFAAYLSKLGFKVNLYYRTLNHVKRIKKKKKVNVKGEMEGTYDLNLVTDEYEQLVGNARLILVATPAFAHQDIIEKLSPYLKNGQIILLNPGRTWGAIHVHNMIMKSRPEINVFVGEAQTLLFTCRKIEDSGVQILKIKDKVQCCFYPEEDNDYMEPIITKIFPQFEFVDDIKITSLTNIGAVIHPAATILNAGSISRESPFLFYSEGMTQPIVNVIKNIDAERCKIMARLGLEPVPLIEWAKSCYGYYSDDYYDVFHSIEPYQDIGSPVTLKMRYLTEDVPTGLVPLSSLGTYFNIPTPFIDALIRLSSCLVGEDFYEIGRTIEKVGVPAEVLHDIESIEFHEYFDIEDHYS
ncbi:MAG: NAD/NADP octopine/nopaline dehydrogenase family protein [Candidatus Hodarchaeota archaeon]